MLCNQPHPEQVLLATAEVRHPQCLKDTIPVCLPVTGAFVSHAYSDVVILLMLDTDAPQLDRCLKITVVTGRVVLQVLVAVACMFISTLTDLVRIH